MSYLGGWVGGYVQEVGGGFFVVLLGFVLGVAGHRIEEEAGDPVGLVGDCGGWVGGWVGWVEENEAVGTSYCEPRVGGWVGGWWGTWVGPLEGGE